MELSPVQLFFEEYGGGIPVIFIHGFPLDHTIWDPMIPILKDKMQMILPDMRGFGRSPVPDGVYSMRLMAEDVLLLLNQLKIDRAVLVGHSMGGYVSLAFTHAYPNRVAGLALCSSQAAADSPEKRQGRYQTAEEITRRGIKALTEKMANKLTNRPELVSQLEKLIMKAQPKGLVGALKGMAERQDALNWLSDINIPAVVIAGEVDSFISMDRSQTMAQLLGKGWLVKLPDVGHMPMLEAPQQSADAILQVVDLIETA
jgi:3-oxoadipate enol-lactonase